MSKALATTIVGFCNKDSDAMFSSVELFSGCGGLALGLSRAGFDHHSLTEFDECAVTTVRHNKKRGIEHVRDWPIAHGDVRAVNWSAYHGATLVAGGPPCQPFSIGGKANGSEDRRDMWPEAVRAVREIGPSAFVFENVRGLLRPKFASYLEGIKGALTQPTEKFGYEIRVELVNAADFGAAQKRHRVIIFGLRKDHSVEVKPLQPSHSRDRLVWDKWITGDYWAQHGIEMNIEDVPKVDEAIVRRLRKLQVCPKTERWVTVRDRLVGLGEPNDTANHVFQPGARVYPGHTGSPLDQPAKALKAGDHGVPGGENMMVRDDGSVRYFTLRESARLQGLPDDYHFPQSWTESMRQLGNAVPVELAESVGAWINKILSQIDVDVAIAA